MSTVDHMGVSPSKVSQTSYPQQATVEQTHDLGNECRISGICCEKDQSVSAQTELTDTDVAASMSLTTEICEPSVKDASEQDDNRSGLQLKEAGMDSLIAKNGSLDQTTVEQNPNCACEHEHNKVGDACLQDKHFSDDDMPTPSTQLTHSQGIGSEPSNCVVKETSQRLPEDVATCDHTEGLRTACEDADRIDNSDGNFCRLQRSIWKTDKPHLSTEERKHGKVEIDPVSSTCNSLEQSEPLPTVVTISTPSKQEDMSADDATLLSAEQPGLPNDGQKSTNGKQLRIPHREVVCGLSYLDHTTKRGSSARGDRKLQLKSQGKQRSTKSGGDPTNVSLDGKKQKRRKKDRKKGTVTDEYTRIRSHLRYLLHRMKFEQSLIVAYSADGWKGQNLEKLKPEKELQRASSDIFRHKVKIRELFKHIDSLCAEGSFPASIFDSDGQISSEDIYCAKCQSKELTAENDIILCDGACDRGFHQFCLIPPLLKEDIPPDDEGWLCPACDCKVDSIAMVNDYLGTNLSITDGWEKVFPEAAATLSSPLPGSNLGVPSDDSEDDDYDPDGPEVDEKSEGGGLGTDESDFSSASEELGTSRDEKYLGLPSDDSEDDDYNPDGRGPDEPAREESSGSDFSSDSEDLDAVLEDNELPEENGNLKVVQRGGIKRRSLNSEPVSTSEPDDIVDDSLLLVGKRNVERLDYRKLYDETYGNGSSDSSDDEDYTAGKKLRKKATVAAPFSKNRVVNSEGTEQVSGDNEITPRRRFRGKSNVKAESSQSTHRIRRGPYKKLGEAVIQRLHESFQENQYPDHSTKEKLAKELELTMDQVTKWFGNARWSYNHSSTPGGSSSKKGTSRKNVSKVPGTAIKQHQGEHHDVNADAVCNGGSQNRKPLENDADGVAESCIKGAGDRKLDAHEGTKSRPRGRKRKSDKQSVEAEVKSEGASMGGSSSQMTLRASGRLKRRRNSVG
ncbi:unnamed protein product [Linum tenue]|uniref:Uncharacterized protein n=1 Tax=Linum tenue TaxID=586396 RepID=A0AAV0PIK0_9ROSI|nr:unnamed protein product [Linum tenue]